MALAEVPRHQRSTGVVLAAWDGHNGR